MADGRCRVGGIGVRTLASIASAFHRTGSIVGGSRLRQAVGVITGVIVGAGLALLLAPKSGAALRDDLGESWMVLRDAVGRRYRDLAERAGVELDNLQERIDQTANAVESSATKLVEAAAQEARHVWGERYQRDDT